jgi:PAS domain S-box-containing protein
MTPFRLPFFADRSAALSHDERYRVLAETAPDAIVTIDETGVILTVNPATEHIFGWPPEALIGQPLVTLMPAHMRRRHAAGMERYLRTGSRKLDWRSVALLGLRRDGTEFPMEVSFGEFLDGDRRIFSGFMRDVSDRAAQQAVIDRTASELSAALVALEQRVHEAEEARTAADEANDAKDQFLRTMSHELRTPLNAIGGFVSLLEDGVRGPMNEAQREDLGRIRLAQARLLALVNDVLHLSKLRNGLAPCDIQPLRVSGALSAVVQTIAPQLEAKGIVLDCDVDTGDMTVAADQRNLEQILLNLLSNAIKFSPPGSRISMVAAAMHDTVHVTVADTGEGIPHDRLEAIFEPFVQVDSTLTRRHEGTGLGLPISRDLAEAMDGTISVTSELGKGSTFTLVLPSAPPV